MGFLSGKSKWDKKDDGKKMPESQETSTPSAPVSFDQVTGVIQELNNKIVEIQQTQSAIQSDIVTRYRQFPNLITTANKDILECVQKTESLIVSAKASLDLLNSRMPEGSSQNASGLQDIVKKIDSLETMILDLTTKPQEVEPSVGSKETSAQTICAERLEQAVKWIEDSIKGLQGQLDRTAQLMAEPNDEIERLQKCLRQKNDALAYEAEEKMALRKACAELSVKLDEQMRVNESLQKDLAAKDELIAEKQRTIEAEKSAHAEEVKALHDEADRRVADERQRVESELRAKETKIKEVKDNLEKAEAEYKAALEKAEKAHEAVLADVKKEYDNARAKWESDHAAEVETLRKERDQAGERVRTEMQQQIGEMNRQMNAFAPPEICALFGYRMDAEMEDESGTLKSRKRALFAFLELLNGRLCKTDFTNRFKAFDETLYEALKDEPEVLDDCRMRVQRYVNEPSEQGDSLGQRAGGLKVCWPKIGEAYSSDEYNSSSESGTHISKVHSALIYREAEKGRVIELKGEVETE